MFNEQRRLKVKFQNDLGNKLEELLGTKEVFIEVEESKELYKRLSKSEDVEDWDWEMEEHPTHAYANPDTITLPVGQIPDSVIIKSGDELIQKVEVNSYLDLVNLIKAYWDTLRTGAVGNSKTPIFFNMVAAEYKTETTKVMSIDKTGIKTLLEFRYTDLSTAKEDIIKRLDIHQDKLLKSESFISAVTSLFN